MTRLFITNSPSFDLAPAPRNQAAPVAAPMSSIGTPITNPRAELAIGRTVQFSGTAYQVAGFEQTPGGTWLVMLQSNCGTITRRLADVVKSGRV